MLAYIGMPKYLQFLISTDERMMIVRAMDKGTATEQTYKVKYQPSKESYIEIHSKVLIDKFGDAFTDYEKGKIYRIFGGVIQGKRSLYFDLKKYYTDKQRNKILSICDEVGYNNINEIKKEMPQFTKYETIRAVILEKYLEELN